MVKSQILEPFPEFHGLQNPPTPAGVRRCRLNKPDSAGISQPPGNPKRLPKCPYSYFFCFFFGIISWRRFRHAFFGSFFKFYQVPASILPPFWYHVGIIFAWNFRTGEMSYFVTSITRQPRFCIPRPSILASKTEQKNMFFRAPFWGIIFLTFLWFLSKVAPKMAPEMTGGIPGGRLFHAPATNPCPQGSFWEVPWSFWGPFLSFWLPFGSILLRFGSL